MNPFPPKIDAPSVSSPLASSCRKSLCLHELSFANDSRSCAFPSVIQRADGSLDNTQAYSRLVTASSPVFPAPSQPGLDIFAVGRPTTCCSCQHPAPQCSSRSAWTAYHKRHRVRTTADFDRPTSPEYFTFRIRN